MAKFNLLCLSLIILSLKSTALAQEFIENSCTLTKFPTECLQTLTPQAAAIGESFAKLAEIALSTSLTKSQALKTFLADECKKPGHGPPEHTALKDCMEGLDDSIDKLTQSVKQMTAKTMTSSDQFMLHKNNLVEWVSSAQSNFNTCVEGFKGTSTDPKFTETIRARVVEVERDATNALSLINNLQKPT